MKYYVKFILLLLYILTFINHNFCFGFKIRDSVSHTDEIDVKHVSKSDNRNRDSESPPQFKKIVKIIHVNEDGTETEEKLAINFERVHKSDFQKPPESKRKRIVIEKIDETPPETTKQSEKPSYSINTILELIGFSKKPVEEPQEKSSETWFQAIFSRQEKDDQPAQPKEEIQDSLGSWKSYLNRWPFNLFLDFINYENIETEGDSEDAKSTIEASKRHAEKEPLSQEDFDHLLRYLPNFIINSSDVKNIECKKQLQIFHRQLRGHKLWTLQMLDASGKITSGILRGNIKQYGDFDLCINIKTSVKITEDQSVRLRGKYCLAHVDIKVISEDLKVPVHFLHGRNMLKSNLENPAHFLPRYTVGNLGICVPNACVSEDVHQMLTSILKSYNSSGINFYIQISDNDCYVKRNQSFTYLLSNNWKIQFSASYYAFFVLLVVSGTIIDCWPIIKQYSSNYFASLLKLSETNTDKNDSNKQSENNEVQKNTEDDLLQKQTVEINNPILNLLLNIILSFSLKRTIEKVIQRDPGENILILDFLKVLSTFCIYLFLKFIMIGHLPIVNRDKLVKIVSHPLSILVRTPLIYLDIFLFISGILSSYRICDEIKNNFKFSIFRRVSGKIIRYIPTMVAVLLFQIWILPHLGSGPLWGNLIKYNSELCNKNFWRNFFFTQNFLNVEETCLPLTVQYAVDFQLFFLAPLLVWLYYKDADLGLIVYGSLHALSVASRFSRTIQDRLSSIIFHGMNISQFYRAANILYASPIYRATPFLIGIGIGIVLKNKDKNALLSKGTLAFGWIASLWSLIWCFWYPSLGSQIDFVYDPKDAAVYSSWAPLLISLSLSWIIFVTYLYGLENSYASIMISKLIIFLSQISYPMQIVSFLVVFYFTAQAKEPEIFYISNLASGTEIAVIIGCATILSVLIDFPMLNIRKILLHYRWKIETCTENAYIEEDEIETEKEVKIKPDNNETVESYNNISDKNNDIERDNIENFKDDVLFGNFKDDVLYFIPRNRIVNDSAYNDDSGFDWTEVEGHGDESWKTESDLDRQMSSPEFDRIIEESEEEEEEEEEEDGQEENVDEDAISDNTNSIKKQSYDERI